MKQNSNNYEFVKQNILNSGVLFVIHFILSIICLIIESNSFQSPLIMFGKNYTPSFVEGILLILNAPYLLLMFIGEIFYHEILGNIFLFSTFQLQWIISTLVSGILWASSILIYSYFMSRNT